MIISTHSHTHVHKTPINFVPSMASADLWGKSGFMLTDAEKKWKAEAYWPVLRWTSPRL